jgi:aldose 1-epimerase
MTEPWGTAPDGSAVSRVTLERGGLTARIISFGAILQDLRMAGHAAPLTLGFDSLAPYHGDAKYFGAIVGRYAGRIAGAEATIDGMHYDLDRNALGGHQLHGGSDGASCRNWTLVEHGDDFAIFTDTLPDGHMGFPGAITMRATYRLLAEQTLEIELEAETDAPTLCNLTSHNYFILDDSGDLAHHTLQIDADRYIPVDETGIPTEAGGDQSVAGGAFDYRTARPLAQDGRIALIDHCFCTGDTAHVPLRPVAKIASTRSGVAMEVQNTEPGLQVFTASTLKAVPPFSGIALEPQGWTDAPHYPDFPSAALAPGERYLNRTRFVFSKG